MNRVHRLGSPKAYWVCASRTSPQAAFYTAYYNRYHDFDLSGSAKTNVFEAGAIVLVCDPKHEEAILERYDCEVLHGYDACKMLKITALHPDSIY